MTKTYTIEFQRIEFYHVDIEAESEAVALHTAQYGDYQMPGEPINVYYDYYEVLEE